MKEIDEIAIPTTMTMMLLKPDFLKIKRKSIR